MKLTFTLAEILLMSLITMRLFSQNFNYISDYDGQGVPLDMVNTSISQNLLDNISASFPEGYPVPDYNPQYIADSIETNVILTELADVWVTFVGEGAGYKNVLGFYTYDALNPPTSPPADEDVTIIFPNVSAAGSGGGLIVGDKMYLGQFPANTGFGWVLIANGWNGNQVTYGNWILYSNPYFNPEGSPELQKHNINLYDDNELVVVFGFEDIRRDFSSCDQDFNDALFLVTSNPYNAMQTGNFNPISTDGGNQSSGNDGGLESHRGLSSTIAKRAFDRSKKKENKISKFSSTRSGSLLSDIVPTSIKTGDERTVSSPTDLELITKAEKVWSADYTSDSKRFASVFATETNEGVYDHTKVVCDRLAGAEIINIREVIIQGQKFLLTSLKTDKESIEYTISFSISINSEREFRVFSKWAVGQYEESGKFLNYQIWSAAPFSTIDLAKTIIANLESSHTFIRQEESNTYLPEVFIKSGRYDKNRIVLNLVNNTNEPAMCNLIGSISASEVNKELELYLKTITIPSGEHQFIIENSNNDIFDLELKIRKNGADQYDVAYFSDGAWGLDYDQSLTSITNLSITGNTANDYGEDNEKSRFTIARNLKVEFESKDYLSVYKHLKPSGKTVNLEEFNALSFEGKFSKPIQIRLIKEGIENWEDQFVYVINPKEDSQNYTIPFSNFRSRTKSNFDAQDVKMIVFTQKTHTGFDAILEFKNVHFTNEEFNQSILNNLLTVYPNPSDGTINITFESLIEESGFLTIYDVLGRIEYKKPIKIHSGLNVIQRAIDHLPEGTHFLNIEGDNLNSLHQKIIIYK